MMKQKSNQKPVARPLLKNKTKNPEPRQSIFESNLDKYAVWITMGLVSVLILIIFHSFISGVLFYLFRDIGSDSINSYFPHFQYINQYIKTDGIPLWSFSQGMGQNIQSISINDPFYLIFYLVDKDNVAYSIIWMEIIKILSTAFVAFHFFRLLKLKPVAIIIGTLLYCFSGFMIVGGGWYMFSTEVFCLAFLLLSFEMLFQSRTWLLFPLAIALIAIDQPFNLFLYGLFFILYFLFRYFTSDSVTLRKFIRMTLQMTALSLLGLLISSFFFWSSLQTLLDSPRVGGSSGYFNKLMSTPVFSFGTESHNIAAILRFFSNDILGNGSKYQGWYNYLEAPLFYIGLLPLLLMPQIFVTVPWRKARIFGLFILILVIPVIFPFFRYFFWLFTGDYYRGFSFFVGLSFLLLTLFAVNEIMGTKKINLVVLVLTFFILMTLLYYHYTNANNIIDSDVQSVVRNFLVVYLFITGLAYFNWFKPYFGVILLCVVFIELGYFNYSALQKRSVLTDQNKKEKFGYNDYSMDAAAYLNAQDKQFFRINKTFTSNPAVHTSYNDAKAQGFYGTMVYGSFNQKYYIRFMEEIGVINKGKEFESRWVIGLISRPLLQNLVSTKYSLVKGSSEFLRRFKYDSIAQFGDVVVLKNGNFLPLGFTYKRYIVLDSFSKISKEKKDMVLQKAFVAENPPDPRFSAFKAYPLKDTLVNYEFKDFFNDVLSLKKDTLAITRFTQNQILGNIELDSSRMLFLSIPYDKGWHTRVDNKEVQPLICNIGFIGLFLDAGKHEIELFYRPPFFHLSLMLTIAGILLYLGLVAGFSIFKKKKPSHEPD
jgi:uncharacterized membrane protein YfhO